MDHAHRGDTALNAGKYDEAITSYTEAIRQSPSSPTYYVKRSIAYQRSSKVRDALHDAEAAVVLANKRAKREIIAQAQLRRGIAFYHLEQYGDAEFLFGLARKLDKNDKSFGMWEDKVKLKIKGLSAEEEPKKKVTVKEMPDIEVPDVTSVTKSASEVPAAAANFQNGTSDSAPTVELPQGVQTAPSKIRHEWYQNNENVYITLLAKGVPRDQATIEIETNSLSISFPLPTGSNYDFSLEPLFGAIDAAASSSKVLSTKIEVTLKKSTPGQKWSSLEGTSPPAAAEQASTSNSAIKQTILSSAPTTAPAYPTSSRTGPKNWDKIVSSYTKPAATHKHSSADNKKSEEDSAATNAGLIEDNDDEGDDVTKFFKTLYKGASDDTRRAMMKSYQESGGTALSTNWEEVGKAPVPIQPPDGMVAKKWES